MGVACSNDQLLEAIIQSPTLSGNGLEKHVRECQLDGQLLHKLWKEESLVKFMDSELKLSAIIQVMVNREIISAFGTPKLMCDGLEIQDLKSLSQVIQGDLAQSSAIENIDHGYVISKSKQTFLVVKYASNNRDIGHEIFVLQKLKEFAAGRATGCVEYYDSDPNSKYVIIGYFGSDIRSLLKPGCTVLGQSNNVLKLVTMLQTLHQLGFMHGDIKPQNILFALDQYHNHEFRLCDLECARQFGEQFPCNKFTRGWVCPEVYERAGTGDVPAIAAIDVFSLGLVFALIFDDARSEIKTMLPCEDEAALAQCLRDQTMLDNRLQCGSHRWALEIVHGMTRIDCDVRASVAATRNLVESCGTTTLAARALAATDLKRISKQIENLHVDAERGVRVLQSSMLHLSIIEVPTNFCLVDPKLTEDTLSNSTFLDAASSRTAMLLAFMNDPLGTAKDTIQEALREPLKMYLLCDCCFQPQPSLGKSSGPWPVTINQPKFFVPKVLPLVQAAVKTACKINGVMQLGSLLGFPIPVVAESTLISAQKFVDDLTVVSSMADYEALQNYLSGDESAKSVEPNDFMNRQMKSFLLGVDSNHHYAGLTKVMLANGSVLFVCAKCKQTAPIAMALSPEHTIDVGKKILKVEKQVAFAQEQKVDNLQTICTDSVTGDIGDDAKMQTGSGQIRSAINSSTPPDGVKKIRKPVVDFVKKRFSTAIDAIAADFDAAQAATAQMETAQAAAAQMETAQAAAAQMETAQAAAAQPCRLNRSAGIVKPSYSTIFGYIAGFGPVNGGALSRPEGVALFTSASKNFLFVSDTCHHRIQVFDSLTGEFVTTIGCRGSELGQFILPRHLVMVDSTLFVCDYDNKRVQYFDVLNDCSALGEIAEMDSGIFGIAHERPTSTHSGKLFVSQPDKHRIRIYDLRTKRLLSTYGEFGKGNDQFNDPRGLAVLARPAFASLLFVCDHFNRRVQVYDVDKGICVQSIFQLSGGECISNPIGVCVTTSSSHRPQHCLLVADDFQICLFDALSGKYFSKIGSLGSGINQLDCAYGIASARNDDDDIVIFVTEYENNRVQIFVHAVNLA